MASIVWGEEIANGYDSTTKRMYAAEVLDPTVDFLYSIVNGGKALEFAIGTGRVALPLSAKGCEVSGIELSSHMVQNLLSKSGAQDLEIHLGDMKETSAGDDFDLVYLVYNTITNVTTQDEQLQVFRNAANHLKHGGHFVVEVAVPRPTSGDSDDRSSLMRINKNHLCLETFEPHSDQLTSFEHWIDRGGQLTRISAQFRYVWPSELVLMGKLAGMELSERWSSWARDEFLASSESQVAVFRKVGPPT